jgi:rhomboid protease GluP
MDKRRMCPHCRAFITTSDRVCPYCNEQVAPQQVRRGGESALGSFIPHARFATVMILVINFGMYVATAIYSLNSGNGGAMGIDGRTLSDFGAMSPWFLALGQWWRLIVSGFLHIDLLHILMNSWALFDLGAMVDEMYGTSRFLVIYFISNVVGFYACYYVNSPAVGASAALFGLIGAMIALGTRYRSTIGSQIRALFIRWLIYSLLFTLMFRASLPAHIGGLVGGFVTGYIAGEPRYEGSATEKVWRVLSWICILLTAFCFLKMYLWLTRGSQ